MDSILAVCRPSHFVSGNRKRISLLVRSMCLSGFVTLTLILLACSSSDVTGPRDRMSYEYNSFLGAREFVLGSNRFSFTLRSMDGKLFGNAKVMVNFFVSENNRMEFRFNLPASYREARGVTPHLHENGDIHKHIDMRGFYVVDDATFDETGIWIARFTVIIGDDTKSSVGELAFNVLKSPIAPGIGQPVPESPTYTLNDLEALGKVDLSIYPKGMHNISVRQALAENRPFMVVWSTPMFCSSQICGPVLDEAKRLQDIYGKEVNFIHIEPWDLYLAQNEGKLVPTSAFKEWNLTTEPWVFIVDSEGTVSSRYEGLVTYEEMEQGLREVLD